MMFEDWYQIGSSLFLHHQILHHKIDHSIFISFSFYYSYLIHFSFILNVHDKHSFSRVNYFCFYFIYGHTINCTKQIFWCEQTIIFVYQCIIICTVTHKAFWIILQKLEFNHFFMNSEILQMKKCNIWRKEEIQVIIWTISAFTEFVAFHFELKLKHEQTSVYPKTMG